jgi:hypothetical protein
MDRSVTSSDERMDRSGRDQATTGQHPSAVDVAAIEVRHL